MDLKDKKVALLGYGLENKALLPYLKSRGAVVTICDKNENLEKDNHNIFYQLGPDYLKNLSNFDIVFRSPGVPFFTPEIQQAKDAGVLVTSQTKLFFEKCPAKIIGVTGTKGKGTTASLIYEILKVAHEKKEIDGKAYLVGNIGVPAITILDNLRHDDWVVFELSSFQLQDLTISPHIAVLTNISQDHLDYHKSMQEYIEAKINIISHQTSQDYAVLNADSKNIKSLWQKTQAKVFIFSRHPTINPGAFIDGQNIILNLPNKGRRVVMGLREVKLPGAFNLENICAAVAASGLAGVGVETMRSAVSSFYGLPHRLEYVGELDGIKFYDDSMSTTPDSTIAAIEAFTAPITLIIGGSGKGADYSNLIKVIKKSSVKNVICVGQEGPRLKQWLERETPETKVISGADNMVGIVRQAKDLSSSGFVVLLSPAAASFDMFKNATDRGEQFQAAVRRL